jgi:hypothetical protein
VAGPRQRGDRPVREPSRCCGAVCSHGRAGSTADKCQRAPARSRAQIAETGFRGGYGTLRDYLRPFGRWATLRRRRRPGRFARSLGWLLRRPDTLDRDELVKVNDGRARCAHLDALARHVTAFAECSPAATASASTRGLPRSRPTTCPSFTPCHRPETRLRRGTQRADAAAQLRRGGRHRRQDQDVEAANVRPRPARPPQAHPARPLNCSARPRDHFDQ